MTPKGGIRPHGRFSIQAKRSEVLFVDYIAEHLSAKGRAAVIVPEGIIFQSAGAYKNLRKMLVENYIVAVVSLPAGVFNPYSGVKTSILFMDKSLAKKARDMLFVKVENDGYDLDAQRRRIEKNDLPEAARQIKAYFDAVKTGAVRDMENPAGALVVGKRKINESVGWDLSGDKYKEDAVVLRSDWPMVALEDILDYEQPTKYVVSSVDYSDDYETPVLTAGKTFILGRTNEKDGVFPGEKLPVIIFDDFTTAIKFVDFPFKVKSSAMKILHAKKEIADARFVFYAMQNINFQRHERHRRYWISQYAKIQIPLPPLNVQREILAEINAYQKIINGARQVVENYTPHISIDPTWPAVKLGEAATVSAGNSAPQDKNLFQGGTHPFCRTADVGKVHISPNLTEISDHLNDQGISGLRCFKKGTILFPKSGASTFLNHRVMLGQDSYVSSHLATINADKRKINEHFLFHLLCKVDAKTLTAEQNYPSLRLSEIKNIKIPLPPLKTQQKITAEIKAEEKLIATNQILIHTFEQKIKTKIAAVWGE